VSAWRHRSHHLAPAGSPFYCDVLPATKRFGGRIEHIGWRVRLDSRRSARVGGGSTHSHPPASETPSYSSRDSLRMQLAPLFSPAFRLRCSTRCQLLSHAGGGSGRCSRARASHASRFERMADGRHHWWAFAVRFGESIADFATSRFPTCGTAPVIAPGIAVLDGGLDKGIRTWREPLTRAANGGTPVGGCLKNAAGAGWRRAWSVSSASSAGGFP